MDAIKDGRKSIRSGIKWKHRLLRGSSTFQTMRARLTISMMPAGHFFKYWLFLLMSPTPTYALKDEFVNYYRILYTRICKCTAFFVNLESFLQFKIPQYSLVASGHYWNYFLFHRVCSYFFQNGRRGTVKSSAGHALTTPGLLNTTFKLRLVPFFLLSRRYVSRSRLNSWRNVVIRS